MTKEEYQVYLQSDHWKKLRSKKIERDGYRCQECGSQNKLEVHHLQYKNIYDVALDDLRVLCHLCHMLHHSKPENTIKIDAEFYRKMAKEGKHKKKKQPQWVIDMNKKKKERSYLDKYKNDLIKRKQNGEKIGFDHKGKFHGTEGDRKTLEEIKRHRNSVRDDHRDKYKVIIHY